MSAATELARCHPHRVLGRSRAAARAPGWPGRDRRHPHARGERRGVADRRVPRGAPAAWWSGSDR
jgi:hypothetical protein